MKLSGLSISTCAAALTAWAVGAAEDELKANLDLPFNALGDLQEEEDAPEVVSFFGMTIEADAFIYVLCGRGEMWHVGEFEAARREVLRNIREFRPRTEFAIVYYNYRGPRLFPAEGSPAKADGSTKGAAEAFLNGLAWDGEFYAWMEEPFREAFRLAEKSVAKRKRIVYVSDGDDEINQPRKVVAGAPEFTAQLLVRITAMNAKRVPVDCVDVSSGGPNTAQSQFLKELAARNRGQYKKVHAPHD